MQLQLLLACSEEAWARASVHARQCVVPNDVVTSPHVVVLNCGEASHFGFVEGVQFWAN